MAPTAMIIAPIDATINILSAITALIFT